MWGNEEEGGGLLGKNIYDLDRLELHPSHSFTLHTFLKKKQHFLPWFKAKMLQGKFQPITTFLPDTKFPKDKVAASNAIHVAQQLASRNCFSHYTLTVRDTAFSGDSGA